MTTLTIEKAIEFERKIIESAESFLSGGDGVSDDGYDAFMNGMEQASEAAKELILSKIEEKKFAKLRNVIKNSILSMMLMQGSGRGLIKSGNNDDLVGLLDTYFLTVLGILMNEEVV